MKDDVRKGSDIRLINDMTSKSNVNVALLLRRVGRRTIRAKKVYRVTCQVVL